MWKVSVEVDKTQDQFWLAEETSVVPWPLQGRWTPICSSFSTLPHSVFLTRRAQWEEAMNSVFSCWATCKRLGEPASRAIPITSAPWTPGSDSLWRCQAPKEVAWRRLRVELTTTGQKHSKHTVFPSLPTETNSEFHFHGTSHQDHI